MWKVILKPAALALALDVAPPPHTHTHRGMPGQGLRGCRTRGSTRFERATETGALGKHLSVGLDRWRRPPLLALAPAAAPHTHPRPQRAAPCPQRNSGERYSSMRSSEAHASIYCRLSCDKVGAGANLAQLCQAPANQGLRQAPCG